MLRRLGLETEVVSDGQAAAEAVRDNPGRFAVVLMDCQMPKKDGVEATQEIRALESQQPDRPRQRIIALTADAVIGSREKYLQMGMDDYLTKPVTITQLKDAINRNCDVDTISLRAV